VFLWVLGIAAMLVVVDQATKWWAESALAGGEVIDVIGDWIQFRLIYNSGAAFSIGAEHTWVFAIASAVVVVVDFIDYFDLFIGNVADIALVGGIAWAALLHLRGIELDGSRAGDGGEAADTADTAGS